MKPSINPQIFREYDIRGIVGTDLTPASVTSIGKAIGTYISRGNGKKMILGRDVRSSSCLLYTSPSPRDQRGSRMPSSA